MEYKSKKYKTVSVALMTITAVLTIALVAVRTWMLSQFYNIDTGYFYCDDIYTVIFYICEALCLVIAVVALVVLGKKIRIVQTVHSSVSLFAGVFCGFLLIASVILYFLETPVKLIFGNYLSLASIALAIVSVIYFIAGSTSQKIACSAKTLLCFSVIFWAMLSLFVIYFDTTLTINNPAKIAEQLALVSVMMYFLYECRIFIEKQRPALYLAVGFISCVLLGVSVLPNIIAIFFLGIDVTSGFHTQIAELGVLIYIVLKTAANIKNIEIKSPEV